LIEAFYRGSLLDTTGTVKEIYEYFKEKEMKGEFVLIIKGRG